MLRGPAAAPPPRADLAKRLELPFAAGPKVWEAQVDGPRPGKTERPAPKSCRSCPTACGRGCVKTLPPSNFGGRLTLGEVEKIAPDAIWRLGISSDATRSAFSHNLGREDDTLTC